MLEKGESGPPSGADCRQAATAWGQEEGDILSGPVGRSGGGSFGP